MARQGKIARLPYEIREQLNRRLQDGEPGRSLLAWLNALPETQAVLSRSFGGVPISDKNLSEWRTGGFAEWEARREPLAQALEAAAATDGKLTDQLATILAGRFAV